MKSAVRFLAVMLVTLSLGIPWALAADPAPLSLSALWAKVDANSAASRGAALEARASRATAERYSAYRQPQLYVRGQYATTDDPVQGFMVKLRQREIRQTDFLEDDLNTPGTTTFGEAALGLTLPLYEGGLGAARTAAAKSAATAGDLHQEAIRVQLYAETVQGYGMLLALRDAAADVASQASRVDAALSGYQLGSASNPVGYSGLLAMRSVALRLKVMGNALSVQQASAASGLSTLADLVPDTWTPESMRLDAFLASVDAASAEGAPEPLPAQALRAQAAAMRQQANAERAVLAPQVGFFVEGSALSGDRGTGTSYIGGAYVRWNLTAPTQDGAAAEALLRSEALQQQANAVTTQAKIAQRESSLAEDALRGRLVLLEESRALLEEQIRTSRRLYDNGTLNFAQLADVLGRRAEVTEAILHTESAYLDARRTRLLHRPEAPHVQ